jgi:hypothetical protein
LCAGCGGCFRGDTNISDQTNPVDCTIRAGGGEVVANTPAEFAARVREDLAKWENLVAAIGLKVDEGG